MKIHLEQIKAKDKFHGKSSYFEDSGFVITCDELVIGVDELQVALGEVESERDNLLEMKEKMQNTKRGLSESEERENLLLKDIEDLKAKHAFAQAEFEQERDELNDVVTKSKLLLQVNTTKYREFSPYANFISANFVTAIFQNIPYIFALSEFWA